MATPYEGGIGGKFPKRPLRRAPATPYDRPSSSSARGGARLLQGDLERGSSASLRSKLVDSASRFIAGGASRIFASFFRKRLAAPPVPPEENQQCRQEVPEVSCMNPSSELHDQGQNGGDKLTESSDVNNSDTEGISELEKLLKKKTFTRVEFDRLMNLLRSRTVEPGTLEPALGSEKRENDNNPTQENRVGASRLHKNLSTVTATLTVAEDEVASPAELAKAYMGSRSSKVSPSTLNLRSRVFHEDTTMSSIVPLVSKTLNKSAIPRSVIRFSGIPPENSYQTPKPRGRTAICQMSCSPYFKVLPTTNVKGGERTGDHYTGPSSSRLTPRNLMHSGGRQVLKRRSSALDTDLDSFGPIRRIRQRSYLMSPSRDGHSRGSSFHNPFRDELKHHNTSIQEAENKESKLSSIIVTPVPPKSSETAMKIFQQLDILMSSPKEKSPELKAIARDKSPSNLTQNVLGGWASRNMEDIDSSKFFKVQDGGALDSNSHSQSLSFISSPSEKQCRVEGNGPSQPASLGVKLTSESCSTVNAAVPSTDSKPGNMNVDFGISGSPALPSRENSSFRASTPEDPWIPDDENHTMRDAPDPLSTKTDELEATISKHNSAVSETLIKEKSLISSSSILDPGSFSFKEAGVKDSGRVVVSGKDTVFSFSVASGPSTHSQPPPTSIMPSPSLDVSALQKENIVTPAFSFSAKAGRTSTVSSTMASIGDTTCQQLGARDATMATAVDASSSGKSSEISEAGYLLKPFGNFVSSGITTTNSSAAFGFGASTTASQCNGSLHPASLVSPLSAAPAMTQSDRRVSSTFFTSTAIPTSTVTTSSMTSPSISSSAPIFTTVNSFQFGSSTSIGAPVSISNEVNDSNSTFGLSKPSSSGFGSDTLGFATVGTQTSTSSGFSFSGGSFSSGLGNTSSFVPAAATSLFSPSSQPFTSNAFGFTFGSSASSPSAGSLFGQPSSASGSLSLAFGSSTTPVFSFTSDVSTTSLATSQTPAVGFGSGSPGNNQMNVEDTMADDTHQGAATPTTSTFGQPASSPITPNFVFGSGNIPSSGLPSFQCVGNQNPFTQSPTFQAGNLEFTPGGGFSVGSGAGDKSGRRIVKIKRDRKHKK